jgi:catechol 2,3-dioxygenase-like lactoylglutathione lyase family enzyme
MATTSATTAPAPAATAAPTVALKLEVVVVPVSDTERAKQFYQGLGWRVDADFGNGAGWRVVQLTPPGSPCSIHVGSGLTTAAPGSMKNLYLVVSDLEAARRELVERGATVSEPFHFTAVGGPPVPGRDPNGRSYRTFASFSDPDGNSWLLQEISARLPGRGESTLDVTTLTALFKEAEARHGRYEPTAPKHHWSDWYAAYVAAREGGQTPDEAAASGARHVHDILQ